MSDQTSDRRNYSELMEIIKLSSNTINVRIDAVYGKVEELSIQMNNMVNRMIAHKQEQNRWNDIHSGQSSDTVHNRHDDDHEEHNKVHQDIRDTMVKIGLWGGVIAFFGIILSGVASQWIFYIIKLSKGWE